jgi:predicted transcriptional regulator
MLTNKKNAPAELCIQYRSSDELKQKILSDLMSPGDEAEKADIIYFDSPASFRKFFTFTKYEIISAIVENKPHSIFELAKSLNRDFPSVLRDCHILKEIGFINLIDAHDAKNTKRPILAFPYQKIVIPALGYRLPVNISESSVA